MLSSAREGSRRPALWVGLACLCLVQGCASPRPVLYPNAHLAQVGAEASQEDIDACIELAENADLGKNRAAETAKSTGIGAGIGAAIGAATGAIFGRPGTGAAAGAAGGGIRGFFRGIFGGGEPAPVFKNYVDTCLRERGYKPVGWK
jgi:hypothetical protein